MARSSPLGRKKNGPNPFDLKLTRLKHDVGGRRIRGTRGRPAQSKQAGIQHRERSLLKEVEQRGRAGGIVDRRFGENDPSVSLEERMLARFTRERQRASRPSAFHLEHEHALTHYGQSLSEMDDLLLPVPDEDGDAQLDHDTVQRTHFGGFGDDEPDRKKTKAEVMAEVIAKSKAHKVRRQMEREHEDGMRQELDQDFDSLRALLYAPDPSAALVDGEDTLDYDKQVRELAFDRRAEPKDRTKTEDELALEQRTALEKAEQQRRLRMLGHDTDSKRPRGADDLDDDFAADEELGAGLGTEDPDQVSSEETDLDDRSSSDGASADVQRSLEPLKVSKELPYTFDAPESHDEFLDITRGLCDSDVSTAVQRIRTLYHHSLSPENKLKLQDLTRILVDHILYVTSLPTPRVQLSAALVPHLLALSRSYPIESAKYFVEKLSLMHKNLKRGLAAGALVPDARTWPGLSELVFLRVAGIIWPTSDLSHPVVSPARLLMGAYLGLCRVRSFRDIASGLFLSTLFLQYESLSRRFVPEAVNFAINATLWLAPHAFASQRSLPGTWPCPDLRSAVCEPLAIDPAQATGLDFRTPDLLQLITSANPLEQSKLDAFGAALGLLERFADMYKSLDGFVELYEPIELVLMGLECGQLSDVVQSRVTSLQEKVARLLRFARQSRQPLLLQAHKPIPIPSYIPMFEASSSSYIRRRDPDRERNEASKLRYKLKQERKGAVRELRKDAKFLAAVEHKKQMEKDRAYKDRMNKVFSSFEGERAEQKAMERERARERRRAGRK